MLRHHIDDWLNRYVPDRGVNFIPVLQTIISTDKGLKRNENQDRIAVMAVQGGDNYDDFLVLAVADGMGGMRDGAECASLAIGALFEALLLRPEVLTTEGVEAAVELANERVFEFSSGRGGATLSALIYNHNQDIIIANVGDSRIYAFEKGDEPRRLTIDDSMAEIVGGHGRELLQFIGMGDALQPHVHIMPTNESFFVTTDGIHFIDEQMLKDIVGNSPNNRAVAERLTALARWCGSPDNASIAVFDPDGLNLTAVTYRERSIPYVDIWDPFSSMRIVLSKDVLVGGEVNIPKMHDVQPGRSKQAPAHNKKSAYKSRAIQKRLRNSIKKSLSASKPIGEVQFEIDMIDDLGKQRDND